MSQRETIQNELVDLIQSRRYTAPYGVLTSLKTLARGGKAREITFGVARSLDATITIWSAKRFTVKAQGALARCFKPVYTDLTELKQDLISTVSEK